MAIMDRVRDLFGAKGAASIPAPEPIMAGPSEGISISAAQYEDGLAQAKEMEMPDDFDLGEDDWVHSNVSLTGRGDWHTFDPGEEVRTSYGHSDKGFHYMVEHSTGGGDREEGWSPAYPTEELSREAASLAADTVVNGILQAPYDEDGRRVNGSFPVEATELWTQQRKDVLLSMESDPNTMQERLANLGPEPSPGTLVLTEQRGFQLEKVSFGADARALWEEQVQTVSQSGSITDQDKKQLIENLGPAPALTQEEHQQALEQGRGSADLGRMEEIAIEANSPEKGVGFDQELSPEDREKKAHEVEEELGMDFG